MWAYRTAVRMVSSYPPLTLAFGKNIIALTKLVWPRARIDNFVEEGNDEVMLLEHDEKEGKREWDLLKELEYTRKMMRHDNTRVAEKGLMTRDLVLLNAHISGINQTKGKLSPKLDGTYIIHDDIWS